VPDPRRRSLWLWLARPAVAVAALGAWTAYVEIWRLPVYVLPHPAKVATTLVRLALSGVLARHALFTLRAAVLGFALGTLAALVLGTLISRSRFVEATLRPYIVATQTTPTLVLAPLFLVWFGFGITSKVLIAALICFFPLLVNVIVGFRSVGESELRLFRAYRAGGWQTFVHLQLPSALPFVFAGLRVTSILCVIGAVVGEFVGSQAGLGYLAVTSAGNLDMDILLSAVVVLMMMGLGLHVLVAAAERKLLFWHESTRR
jgi:NitT/TauT family transport system permease protein